MPVNALIKYGTRQNVLVALFSDIYNIVCIKF